MDETSETRMPAEREDRIDASCVDGFDVDEEEERWRVPRSGDRHHTRVPIHKKYQ